jgi:hypothetical protein
MLVLYRDNDNLLEVLGASAVGPTGALVPLDASASVTVTLRDAAQQPVAGATWPLALTYRAGSAGDFYAVLPAALVLTDTHLTAHLRITTAAAHQGVWTLELRVDPRTA